MGSAVGCCVGEFDDGDALADSCGVRVGVLVEVGDGEFVEVGDGEGVAVAVGVGVGVV